MKKLIIISLVSATLLLSGCGSSSSDTDTKAQIQKSDETTNTNPIISQTPKTDETTNNSISNWKPLTEKVSCDPKELVITGATIDFKYYADGDIKIECQEIQGFTIATYKLDENIQSLDITQLIKSETINGNIKDDTGKSGTFDGVTTYDYQKGTQHIQGHYTYNGKKENIDCIETYPTILPKTITSDNDISSLLEWEGDDIGEYTQTTCPESYYDENDELDIEDENTKWRGTVNMNTNYTLTDSKGKKHLLSTEMSMKR